LAETAPAALARRAETLGAPLPPLLVAAQRVAATVAQGVHGRRRAGQGDSFWQFRPFVAGDSSARIDWRQSAKTSRAFIRETEWEAAHTVSLWRDGSASMHWRSRRDLPTKAERADLLLLALAALLLRGGERVALLGGGRMPASGRGALNAMLAGLRQDTPLSSIAQSAPRHATLVLFGDFLDPIDEIARALDRVATSGVAGEMVQILDPAEIALSFEGRIRFREMAADAPSTGDALIPRVAAIRSAYLDALARQQDGLAALARARGWGFQVHGTDRPPEEPLRALHARLSARLTDAGAPI
jgi:uncharacterized protein (DUF58 family)